MTEQLILGIIALLMIAGVVYYLKWYLPKAGDVNKNNIPDHIDARISRAKEEVKDALKQFEKGLEELSDIKPALQGKPRRGRYTGKKPPKKK